jgi:hypothetical protein
MYSRSGERVIFPLLFDRDAFIDLARQFFDLGGYLDYSRRAKQREIRIRGDSDTEA